MTSARRDPCCAATKGFRDAILAISSPIVDTSHPGKKHERKQSIVKEFFFQNPTPARVELDNAANDEIQGIQIQSLTDQNAALASVPFAEQHVPVAANPSTEFYSQLLETLKTIKQAASQQQKIVVELRKHEESVDLAKLQTSMLKSFYVNGVIN